MKLFMVYLGGSAGQSNIELHDIRFVVGDCIEDTIPQLRAEWFGNQKNLHIDCYMEVNHIDGYKVEVQTLPSNGLATISSGKKQIQDSNLKLYFVNLGGYQADKFTELHEFGLFVACSKEDAKQQAKSKLMQKAITPHKDNLVDVDECFPINLFDDRYSIHLTELPGGQKLVPDWFGYNVIGHK